MAIQDLIKLVPPPAHPVCVGTMDDWLAVEAGLGVKFPEDYRQLCMQYGCGTFFEGYIYVDCPFKPAYLEEARRELNDMRDWAKRHPEDSMIVYPEKNGLLKWGSNEDGHIFCWQTSGVPEKWPVVVLQHGGGRKQYRMDCTAFLADIMRGKIESVGAPINSEELQVDFRQMPDPRFKKPPK